MKILLIWFLIQSVLSLKGCKHSLKNLFFNLESLENSPVEGDYEIHFTFENQSMKLILNFCKPTYDKCIDGKQDFAHILNLNNMDCIHLTSAGNSQGQKARVEDGSLNYLKLIYEPGISQCRYGSTNYDFEVEIVCDQSKEPGKPNLHLVQSSLYSCRPKIFMNAIEACGSKIYFPLWAYAESIKELLGITMIILGLLTALFGFQLMRFIFFTIGYATVVILCFFFLYEVVLPQSTSDYMGWVILFTASIMGVLFGVLMERHGRVAIGFLGAWLGGVIGITFYVAFLHELSDPKLMISMTIFPPAIICIVFSILKWERMIVICTGVCGSYFTIRGLSLIAGQYPNQFTVHQQIKSGQLDSFPWEVYLYLAGMLSLSIVTVGFQIYRQSRDAEENHLKRKNYMYM